MADIKKSSIFRFSEPEQALLSLISSAEGGVEIESAGNKVVIDIPIDGLSPQTAEDTAARLGLSGRTVVSFVDFTTKLSRLVDEKEAELAEINPVAILGDGSLMALDAKVIIDDNSMFRHPELKSTSMSRNLKSRQRSAAFHSSSWMATSQ